MISWSLLLDLVDARDVFEGDAARPSVCSLAFDRPKLIARPFEPWMLRMKPEEHDHHRDRHEAVWMMFQIRLSSSTAC
jgi:hypothetical protein